MNAPFPHGGPRAHGGGGFQQAGRADADGLMMYIVLDLIKQK